MSLFLERVVEEKAAEIKDKLNRVPLESLVRSAEQEPVRDFKAALTGENRIIAEVKRKSPSVKSFKLSVSPARMASIYEQNGAAAISIVTDEANFGTTLTDVADIRASVTLPVLVKEFVIDSYQIREAWAAGADGLLLIARILTKEALMAFLKEIHDYGMFALIECHDPTDIKKAIGAGGQIIGINNRDLSTLKTSLDVSRELIPSMPTDVIRVSESGINNRDQVVELAASGAGVFLIGGALLTTADPGQKLRQLLGTESEPVPEV